jgi:hypothetical protein
MSGSLPFDSRSRWLMIIPVHYAFLPGGPGRSVKSRMSWVKASGASRARKWPASFTIVIWAPGIDRKLASREVPEGFVADIDHSSAMIQKAKKRNAGAIARGS